MSATSEAGMTAASTATASPASAPPRRLGLALAVIATAQLMVVLDATIVNVALPHIQTALGFSDSNLEWVVNAYALTFGGLLLLGGRAGDLLGRRRIFIAGIVLFSLASLLGGFATDQAWMLAARALQGVGGALAAPTALSLIAVTFPEGPPRNRAMSVYASMSVAGGAVGLIVAACSPRTRTGGGCCSSTCRSACWWRSSRRGCSASPSVFGSTAAASTCPARSQGRSAWPPWSTACPAPRPRRTASRTGVTPRCSSRSRRRWCCWSCSRSSRCAASTR